MDIACSRRCHMEDDLTILGVVPSDRKKLENMGITTLEQIAIMSVSSLGMGSSKGTMLVQRARNILANENILDITITNGDLIEVTSKKTDRAVIKSILNALDVYVVGWGNAALTIEGNVLKLSRKSEAFSKVISKAESLREILDSKKNMEREKSGIYLPEDELRKFARARGFHGFWENVFQEIHGNDIMKKVIAASMFSTFEEPVHSLIIGEPGSSKTMAKEIITEQFSDITIIGANTTRSGLVCHLGTGDLGVLPHSDQKLVLVDEFDKIPGEDIEYCYELLSNGKCSVHSAKLHQNIESNFIMIAFANPKSQVFGKNALKDIGLSPLLMSRCALVVKVQNISKEDRMNLFRKKFYGTGEMKEKQQYYDQWVKLARRYEPAIVASEKSVNRYLTTMNDIVEEHYSTTLRRDLRMSDYLRRIPRALARSSFNPVDNKVLGEAEHLIEESIETWGVN
jgi:DNA replicative helicase MCM subunit Mcm2 (Cdc46/Mcm family)